MQMLKTESEVSYLIRGLDCASCALTVEKGVSKLDGVQSCKLNFSTQKLRVMGDVQEVDVIGRVRELGYDVVDSHADSQTEAEISHPSNFFQFIWQRRETRMALFGGILIIPGLLLTELFSVDHFLIDIASIVALILAGIPIFRSAFQALRINHTLNIDALMSIASIGAVFIDLYTEAGMVMVLFAIGEALEGYTASRSRESIRSLMEVVPNKATLLLDQEGKVQQKRVVVDRLKPGDTILVKPGERIPMDGRVINGASSVNQAPITGESRLIEKVAGSIVFASSINGEGALEVEVTHLASDNTISRVIQMVEEAQEKKAPTQRFIDRFARYYTPAVVILAAIAIVVPPLFFQQPLLNPEPGVYGWLYRGLALLVVGCPCALVISTPVSIISAISNAARNGVLIKGGVHLEALSMVKTIALDKTGTITEGRPAVVEVRSAPHIEATEDDSQDHFLQDHQPQAVLTCEECREIVALACAVEQGSEHPLASAIISYAARQGLDNKYPAAEMVTAIPGKGVTGQVAGHQVTIGSHSYFENQVPHRKTVCEDSERAAALGYTSLMISRDGEYMGTITVADTIRENSREALAMIKEAGVKSLVMLTGDNSGAARLISQQVGMTEMQAELLPENKAAAIKMLQKENGLVAMVGDGINDAPALATADVGIAIGAALVRTAQAMETADITLMSDDLRRLPFALRLSQAAMRTIKTNVAFSLAIKFAFMILVLLGMGTMWMAVFADMGASLLVTLNGMRLLRRPEREGE